MFYKSFCCANNIYQENSSYTVKTATQVKKARDEIDDVVWSDIFARDGPEEVHKEFLLIGSQPRYSKNYDTLGGTAKPLE